MRTCRCFECRDSKAEVSAGTVEWLRFYGNGCGNCGFYAPIKADEGQGYCLRAQGRIRKGGVAPIVGGTFSCVEFRPCHEMPER